MNIRADSYWDTYYNTGTTPLVPSQFAVFMMNEYPQAEAVIDVGCGNGRDALFFARHGKAVIGIDGSATAVSVCQRANLPSATFIQSSVEDASLTERIAKNLLPGFLMVYARFFLHAIDEAAEKQMLGFARELLHGRSGVFGLEFRTSRDQALAKVTPDHYRRYVDPSDFISRAAAAGFKRIYSAEGFGMAKYKDDDAHVARVVLAAA